MFPQTFITSDKLTSFVFVGEKCHFGYEIRSARILGKVKQLVISGNVEDITWPRGDTKFLFEC